MPTYDYVCDECGHAFEEFQMMSAKPLKKCPECGKMKLRRLIGAGAGVIFKGSGFYETDYRSDSYSKGQKAASAAKKSEKKEAAAPKSESKSSDSKASGSGSGGGSGSASGGSGGSKKAAAAK